MSAQVVVVGGGVVGASAAYHLARGGAHVTLVDRADQGQATAAGAGIVAPAVSLRPFPAYFPLAYAAVASFPELLASLAEDGEAETGYETVGLLFIAMDEADAARLPEVKRLFEERVAAGAPNLGLVTMLEGREAKALFPALGDIPAAILVPDAARLSGRLLRDALSRAARRRGVEIVAADAALVLVDDRVTGVRVEDRVIAADAIVIAAGAWSQAFTAPLGVDVPVYPQRGQILHLDLPGSGAARWPIIQGFPSHYLLTFPGDRVVVGATREDGAGYDPRVTAGGVREVLSNALQVAPGLAGATVAEMRVGLRPASPDGLPILGPVPGFPTVYLATGQGPTGLQLGPYSGAAMAALILGQPVALDLAPYAVTRFS